LGAAAPAFFRLLRPPGSASPSPHVQSIPNRKGAAMKAGVVFSLVAAAAALAACATNQPGSTALRTEACRASSEQEIAALFDRWNASLQSGDPRQVLANYADKSVLLATLSNTPRLSARQKEDYFRYFLQDRPSGRIDSRTVVMGCNSAVDTGLYTFTFGRTGAVVKARYTYTYQWDGGRWLITSHHSSAMPEK
jgi:uncharacterized protein (TIGR02246 family)